MSNMTNIELQVIQNRTKLDGPSMALCMGVDYEHYRRLYYGTAAISEREARSAMEIDKINTEFMDRRYHRDDECGKEICAKYPGGIVSAPVEALT